MNKYNPTHDKFEKLSGKLVKNEKPFSKIKDYVLIILALFMVATLIFTFFGANVAIDLQPHASFAVDYKATISKENYEIYKNKITEIVNEEDGLLVTFIESGDNVADTKLFVQIINNSNLEESKFLEKVENITTNIENEWIKDILNLEISDVLNNQPHILNSIINPFIALIVILAIVVIYTWIRYDLFAALGHVIAAFSSISLLLSSIIIFRIPLTSSFTSYFTVAVFLSMVIFMVIISSIKTREQLGHTTTNANHVFSVVCRQLPALLLVTAIAKVALLIGICTFLFINTTLAFALITIFVSMLVGVLVGVFVAPAFWVAFYNRDNDKRLQQRLTKKALKTQTKNKQTNQEQDDKIVV